MARPDASDLRARAVQEAVMVKLGRNRPANSFTPARERASQVGDDGVLYINDVPYGTEYPNSFLDVWYPDTNIEQPRPVLIYFHGGGFLFGDKVAGDPLADETQVGVKSLIKPFLDDGFCVVCPEYAFAPDHRYPTQVKQVDHVISFLQSHRDEFAVDTDRIVIMGGSAGANLTEIYGLVVSDERYAERLGIEPSVRAGQVRGLIVDEAALGLGDLADENMRTLSETWLGDTDLEGSEQAEQTDVPGNIAGSYPPVFINASNVEPFFRQSAEALRDVLDRDGLPYEYFYRDQAVDSLEHGYVNRHRTNAVAKECLEQMREFARRVIR